MNNKNNNILTSVQYVLGDKRKNYQEAKGFEESELPALPDLWGWGDYFQSTKSIIEFEIESADGKIILRGNNGVSLASAYGYYLREFCKVHYSLWGNQMKLPETLSVVPEKIKIVNPNQITTKHTN